MEFVAVILHRVCVCVCHAYIQATLINLMAIKSEVGFRPIKKDGALQGCRGSFRIRALMIYRSTD